MSTEKFQAVLRSAAEYLGVDTDDLRVDFTQDVEVVRDEDGNIVSDGGFVVRRAVPRSQRLTISIAR